MVVSRVQIRAHLLGHRDRGHLFLDPVRLTGANFLRGGRPQTHQRAVKPHVPHRAGLGV